METSTSVDTNWKRLTDSIGQTFAARAEAHDRDGRFVYENYSDLKALRYFSAAIPEEMGGGGLTHTEMCTLLRMLAKHCGSTALALSMHQHLIAATIWRYRNKGEGGPLLKRVVEEQLVLVSTGAGDWLESHGEMVKVEGGYLLTAKKAFASQSVVGDIIVTSGPYQHPEQGWQVLHFAVPMNAEGVSILDDWDVMGMRATGSQTVVLNKVFIPDSSIVLARPRTGFHPVWDVAITVAMPLIMGVYVGIAEKAMEIAIEIGRTNIRNQNHFAYIIGKMYNTLIGARKEWDAMVSLTNNIDFKPSSKITMDMVSLKANVTTACIQTVQQAMDAVGGRSFYKRNILERLFRDVQGAQFHPMPTWDQYEFTGKGLLANI